MRTKLMLVPALALAAALALTGCSNSTPNDSSNKEDIASGVTVDKAAAALLPADITKAGVLTIGIDPTYAPNEYKDDAGNPIGWDVDLANAIAAKLGVKTEFQVSSFDNIIPSVAAGKQNLGVSSFTDNAEREAQVDFVNYYQAGMLWASPKGSDVNPDNACGLKVAVQADTTSQDEVQAKSDACVKAGKKAIEIVKFDGQDSATNAVVLGQADAMSADSPITLGAIKATGDKLQIAGKTFDVAPYGVAVAKGSPLAKAIQAAIQSLIDDGTYMKILNNAGVADGAVTKATINAGANG